jgi:hypothetical protein
MVMVTGDAIVGWHDGHRNHNKSSGQLFLRKKRRSNGHTDILVKRLKEGGSNWLEE